MGNKSATQNLANNARTDDGPEQEDLEVKVILVMRKVGGKTEYFLEWQDDDEVETIREQISSPAYVKACRSVFEAKDKLKREKEMKQMDLENKRKVLEEKKRKLEQEIEELEAEEKRAKRKKLSEEGERSSGEETPKEGSKTNVNIEVGVDCRISFGPDSDNKIKPNETDFGLVCQDERRRLHEQKQGLTLEEVPRELATLWKAAGPETKQRYGLLAEEDKNRFEMAMIIKEVEQFEKRKLNKRVESSTCSSCSILDPECFAAVTTNNPMAQLSQPFSSRPIWPSPRVNVSVPPPCGQIPKDFSFFTKNNYAMRKCGDLRMPHIRMSTEKGNMGGDVDLKCKEPCKPFAVEDKKRDEKEMEKLKKTFMGSGANLGPENKDKDIGNEAKEPVEVCPKGPAAAPAKAAGSPLKANVLASSTPKSPSPTPSTSKACVSKHSFHPAPAQSAYSLFCLDERPKLNGKFNKVSAELLKLWEKAGPETKERYQALAAQDMKRYLKEWAEYRKGHDQSQ